MSPGFPGHSQDLGILRFNWDDSACMLRTDEACDKYAYEHVSAKQGSGILVLAGTAGACRMAPPASTRISARLKRVGNAVHT